MLESINSGKIKNKQLSYRLENRASAACTSFQRNMLLLKFGFLACSSLLSIVGLFFAAGVFFLLHLCSEKSPITVKLCHIYMIGNGCAKKICRKNFGASRKKMEEANKTCKPRHDRLRTTSEFDCNISGKDQDIDTRITALSTIIN